MSIMEQIRLMEKLSPLADEIINAYNEGGKQFKPINKELFDRYHTKVAEIVQGTGINAEYRNGIVYINKMDE